MFQIRAIVASRRLLLRCLLASLAVFILASLVFYFTPRTVQVGRRWPIGERVGVGDVSHQTWDELLHRYVDAEGRVDYASWKASTEDLKRLDEYLNELSRLDEQQPTNKSRQIEFWVNAYNALTVRGLLREYPTSSIQNHVDRLWGYNIWRDLRLVMGDKSYSLGEIEHSILRPLREPRVHFAMVCGSNGCPRLRNEAYAAERLEDQLKDNTLAFFADASKCAYDAERKELRLSPILKWYATDFGDSHSADLPEIADWLPADIRSATQSGDVKVLYGDYDWSLNEQGNVIPPLPETEPESATK